MFNFPYTNFHELNLDWILNKIKELFSTAVFTVNSTAPDRHGNVNLSGVSGVTSVNGIGADGAGNVQITAADIPAYPVINLNSYDPYADGITDDSAILSAAITDAAGKELFIPNGTYLIQSSLSIPANTIIRGQSKENTILIFTGPNAECLNLANFNCEIHNITLDGNNVGSKGIIINAGGCMINNCLVRKFVSNGIECHSPNPQFTADSAVLNKIINTCSMINGGRGFYADSYDMIISNCDGVSNSGGNLAAPKCCKVSDSHFWNYSDGWGFTRPNWSVELYGADSCFTNCHIEGSLTNCLYIAPAATRCLFSNCSFYACFGSYTVNVEGENCVFTGCRFGGADPNSTTTWTACIRCAADNLIVSGCYCEDTAMATFNDAISYTTIIGTGTDAVPGWTTLHGINIIQGYTNNPALPWSV